MKHRQGFALDVPEELATADAVEGYRRSCQQLGHEPCAEPSIEVVRSDELAANGEYLIVVRG